MKWMKVGKKKFGLVNNKYAMNEGRKERKK